MLPKPQNPDLPRFSFSAISVSGTLYVKVEDISKAMEGSIEDAALQEERFSPPEIAGMLTLQDFIESGFDKIKADVLRMQVEMGDLPGFW